MKENKINLAILGADGNMGRYISNLALDDEDFKITHAYTIPNSPNLGTDIGVLVGKPREGTAITSIENFEKDLQTHPPDVIIDFTVAKGTEINGIVAAKNKTPIVIGTTGMSEQFYKEFEKLIIETKCSSVLATNMATGMNIFFKMVQEVAKYVMDWDIEVIEAHHHRKRDSPSGTALTIAEKISQVLNKNLKDIAKYGREKGPTPRKLGSEEIGIHAIRAGDIVGEHTVLYAGKGERIELTHRAHSRECFASGSLTAAKFLVKNKDKGQIFDMQDVLGIE